MADRQALAAVRDATIRIGDDLYDIVTTPSARVELATAVMAYIDNRTAEAMQAIADHTDI